MPQRNDTLHSLTVLYFLQMNVFGVRGNAVDVRSLGENEHLAHVVGRLDA